MNINQPVILCGFTSSGKTTIGKLLAEHLELPFFDTDQMLTDQNNMTIIEIFAKGGEALFRDLEHEIAKQICTLGPSVISTGGGMLTFPRNGELLTQHGLIIYIDRPFDHCYENLSRTPDRPLFKNNTREELEALYNERKAKYLSYATHTIKNDSTREDAVTAICNILESSCR